MRETNGFTIIELIVVISVISILISIGTVAYTKIQQTANDNRRSADISALKSSLESYYSNNGTYPADDTARGGATSLYVSADTITSSTTLANIQQLFPKLNQKFGDGTGSTALFNNLSQPSYIYVGGLTASQPVTVSKTLTISWPKVSLSCSYSVQLAAGQSSSYVVGYYNEQDKSIKFSKGSKGIPLTWPQDASAQPGCVTSS